MTPRSRLSVLRLLGIALLVALLSAGPVAADDHDDDDHDDHGTSTAVSGGHDDDHDDDHDDHGASTATAGADDDRFGSFLHRGACDDLGETVEDLEELDDDRDDRDDDAGKVWARIGGEDDQPDPFWADDDDVDLALDAITAEAHVLTVHETDDADSPVIACGALTGERDADGGLLIDLAEVDDSGYEGRAYLVPDAGDDDDDETEVFIGLWEVQAAGV